MANGELIDAREAMGMLGIGEGELQNLVARGDLRAFRTAGTMKFRREDVMSLKTEKPTEQTVIIPPSGTRRPGQSGILAPPPQAAPAAPAAPVGADSNATGHIMIEDIELQLPTTQDGTGTSQQTVVSSPVSSGVSSSATLVDQGVGGAPTGDMTVVEKAAEGEQITTGPSVPVQPRPVSRTGSRVGSGVSAPGPAVSRVKQPSVAIARRTATVYEPKSGNPIWTGVLVLSAAAMLFAAVAIVGIMFHGHYDAASGKRVIPPYLKALNVYETFYDGSVVGPLPGRPRDTLGADDPDRVTTPEPAS